VTYPIIDGIVDFCGRTEDKVSTAYDKVAHRYDAILSRSNIARRICNSMVWRIGDDRIYVETVLSDFPAQFEGILLDVPIGTGAFTSSLYVGYPDAAIIGIDSSMNMLHKARERLLKAGLKNICLLRADAANLSLKNA